MQAKAGGGFAKAETVVLSEDDFFGIVLPQLVAEEEGIPGGRGGKSEPGELGKAGPGFIPKTGKGLGQQRDEGHVPFVQKDAGLEFKVVWIEPQERGLIRGIDVKRLDRSARIGPETIPQRAIGEQAAESGLKINCGRRVAGGGGVHRPGRWHRGNQRRVRG